MEQWQVSIFKEERFAAMTSPFMAVAVMFGPGGIGMALDQSSDVNWIVWGMFWQLPASLIAYAASSFKKHAVWNEIDLELWRRTNKFAPWWSTGYAVLGWVWPLWLASGMVNGMRRQD